MQRFDTPCPHCAAKNSVWRAARSLSGIHIRCLACDHTFRLLHVPTDLILTAAAFLAVYLPVTQISLLTMVERPVQRWVVLVAAGWPVLPAFAASGAAALGLHRRNYVDGERAVVPRNRLSGPAMLVWATLVVVGMLALLWGALAVLPLSVDQL